MKLCKDCKHFHIQCEPYKVGGQIWDFGLARCEKYNLVTEFISHKKFETLSCKDDFSGQHDGLKVTITIPKTFLEHWNHDKFEDSLLRLKIDANNVAGRYEQELCDMLVDAFKNAEVNNE